MPVFISAFQNDENTSLTTNRRPVSDGRDQGRVSLGEVFAAGRREAIYRNNTDALQERRREAYRRRIAALLPVTGGARGPLAGLRNPEDIWDENKQAARLQGGGFTALRQRRIFAATLDNLAQSRKDIDPKLLTSVEDNDVAAVGLEASASLVEVKDRRSHQSMLANVDTEAAALAGAFVGSLSDPTALPQFLAGILSGGTSLVGKNIAQQVLITGAREATAGAVMEGALQGVRKTNEEQLGVTYGAREMAGAIGGAALAGAVIGGAGEAVGAGVRKLVTGRALPMNDPVVIEPTRPNQARQSNAPQIEVPELPDNLARFVAASEPQSPPARPEPFVGDLEGNAALPPDDGVRPFGFVAPDSDRLVDWERAFEAADSEMPPAMRAALSVIEAENASVAASRATPAPYRVPDSDGLRATEKAYAALELGEPLPAPALPRRFAALPDGADASMPMHPDEALAAARVWRVTGEHPALAAGDPQLLDLIEDLGRLSNATFDQVQNGDLSEDMGAVIGALAWNRPDTHQELSAMLIEADVGDVAVARQMVSDRLADLTPDASGALLGVRALPVLPALDMGDVTPLRLADALKRAPPAIPRSLDDLDVMAPLESARAFAERAAQKQLREAANLAKRKPDPDMLDGDWKERVASLRANALRDLAILDKGGLPESGYQALDDVMRARGKAIAPKRRAKPIEPGNDAAIQQGRDAAGATGLDDVARVKSALNPAERTRLSVEAGGTQGPIIKGLEGNFSGAVDLLTRLKTGQVNGAMKHPDLGAINLIWGDRKAGLAHILAKHRDDLADLTVFEQAFAAAKIQPESKGSVVVLSDGAYFFDVRKDWMGQPNSWLLTGFRAKNPDTQSGKITARAKMSEGLAGDRTITGTTTSDQALLALDRQTQTILSPISEKINDAANDLGQDASFDLIDMIVDPDGIGGNAQNPGAMTARDAAKVAARDDFMVERFRGCIL